MAMCFVAAAFVPLCNDAAFNASFSSGESTTSGSAAAAAEGLAGNFTLFDCAMSVADTPSIQSAPLPAPSLSLSLDPSESCSSTFLRFRGTCPAASRDFQLDELPTLACLSTAARAASSEHVTRGCDDVRAIPNGLV